MSRISRPAAAAVLVDLPVYDADHAFQHLRTSAAMAGVHKPPGVAISVFDAGRRAKPPAPPRKTRQAAAPLRLESLLIEEGVPLSPVRTDVSEYVTLLEKMQPGQSVLLSFGQIRNLRAAAKRVGVPMAARMLSAEQGRVWRLAGAAGPAKVRP